MKQHLILIAICLLLFCLLACGQARSSAQPPQATSGVLDLKQWDFDRDGPVQLRGAWEFYWEQLLISDDFSKESFPLRESLITVPGSWQGHEVKGQTLTGFGYATYRLTILIDPNTLPEQFLALQMPVWLNTAHKLYVDGQVLGGAGQVGRTAETMTPQYHPYTAIVKPTSECIEILLQVANFYHHRGGILPDPLLLGPQTQISQRNQRQMGRDLFLIGSVLMTGLYHLVLFGLRRHEKPPLYFGLFCLGIAVVTWLDRQPAVWVDVFSQSWAVFIRLRLLLTIFIVVSQALFVQTLFLHPMTRIFLRIIISLGLLLGSLSLLVAANAVTTFALIVSLYAALILLYNLGVVFVAALHQKDGATIFILGYLPLIIAVLNDILILNNLLQTISLTSVGIFIFVFSQAYLLSWRFSQAFTQMEQLSEELQQNYQALGQTQAQLKQSETKYRTLFEDSQDLIFIMALDGRLEEVNPICFDVLGYKRDEVLGMNIFDFFVEPLDQQRVREAIAQKDVVSDLEITLRHGEGQEIDCQMTATLYHDDQGRGRGYQGILHDMSTYKQVEASRQRVLALQDLNRTLEQRVEGRTLALSKANQDLQTEIEQRKSHQAEKERLIELAQQQGKHLRFLSSWILEMQYNQSQDLSSDLDSEIQQKIDLIRQNLTILQSTVVLEQDPNLMTYIAETVRLLAEMEIYIERVTTSLAEPSDQSDPLAENPLLQLSKRERQVLALIAEGKSNPEIADLMTIRLNTVHTYLKRIRHKLDIQDISGLVEFARKNKLLD